MEAVGELAEEEAAAVETAEAEMVETEVAVEAAAEDCTFNHNKTYPSAAINATASEFQAFIPHHAAADAKLEASNKTKTKMTKQNKAKTYSTHLGGGGGSGDGGGGLHMPPAHQAPLQHII